jgi:hypothetical protein
MQLLEQRGGFLHQHRPDIIPQGYLTDEEIGLWVAYYERKALEESRRG